MSCVRLALVGIAIAFALPARADNEVVSATSGVGFSRSTQTMGMVSLDLNVGYRFQLRRTRWSLGPEGGVTFDWQFANTNTAYAHAALGPTLSYRLASHTINMKLAALTDLKHFGLRQAFRFGMFHGIIPIEAQYDLIFLGSILDHRVRFLIGVDLGAWVEWLRNALEPRAE